MWNHLLDNAWKVAAQAKAAAEKLEDSLNASVGSTTTLTNTTTTTTVEPSSSPSHSVIDSFLSEDEFESEKKENQVFIVPTEEEEEEEEEDDDDDEGQDPQNPWSDDSMISSTVIQKEYVHSSPQETVEEVVQVEDHVETDGWNDNDNDIIVQDDNDEDDLPGNKAIAIPHSTNAHDNVPIAHRQEPQQDASTQLLEQEDKNELCPFSSHHETIPSWNQPMSVSLQTENEEYLYLHEDARSHVSSVCQQDTHDSSIPNSMPWEKDRQHYQQEQQVAKEEPNTPQDGHIDKLRMIHALQQEKIVELEEESMVPQKHDPDTSPMTRILDPMENCTSFNSTTTLNDPVPVNHVSLGDKIQENLSSSSSSFNPTMVIQQQDLNPMNVQSYQFNGEQQQQQQEYHERFLILEEKYQLDIASLQSQISHLEYNLKQRESQLTSKSEQITTMMEIHEKEREELLTKIQETKQEAKKRITAAKERVDEMQKKLVLAESNAAAASANSNNTSSTTLQEKEELIRTLRTEGETLARKIGELEQRVKDGRTQVFNLQDALEQQSATREKVEKKVVDLETEVKTLKNKLAIAKQGETRAEKLEMDLLSVREEVEKKGGIIFAYENEVKELKLEIATIRKEKDDMYRLKEVENQSDMAKLMKDKVDLMEDFEAKLRNTEREATLREDALRNEVTELRKRWQDAVRRADALSMDIQQSSAPLMRQLESTERQNRARATAWAELETRLRNENEDLIVKNDALVKEKNDLVAALRRLERSMKDRSDELAKSLSEIEELRGAKSDAESKFEECQRSLQSLTKDYSALVKSTKDHENKIKSDMMKIMQDNDTVYNAELEKEREKRLALESKIEELLSSTVTYQSSVQSTTDPNDVKSVRRNRLGVKHDQANILQNTLLGLSVDEDNDDHELGRELNHVDLNKGNGSSYAYTEQLLQGVKTAKVELEALRNQVQETEATKEKLLAELSYCKDAAERLPGLETTLMRLKSEIAEKDVEIIGLREDIADVRMLYRAQLDQLLEERTANTAISYDGVKVSPLSALSTPSKPFREPVSSSGLDNLNTSFGSM